MSLSKHRTKWVVSHSVALKISSVSCSLWPRRSAKSDCTFTSSLSPHYCKCYCFMFPHKHSTLSLAPHLSHYNNFFSPQMSFVFFPLSISSLHFHPTSLRRTDIRTEYCVVQRHKDSQQPFPNSPFWRLWEIISAFYAQSALVVHVEAIIWPLRPFQIHTVFHKTVVHPIGIACTLVLPSVLACILLY